MVPRCPKLVPRWLQDGPQMAQDGSKRCQDGPETAPNGPQMAQDAPKMATRWGWGPVWEQFLADLGTWAAPGPGASGPGPLGLSWALRPLLGVSWLVWVVSCVHFSSPGRPGTRFLKVWGSARLGFGRLREHVLACLVLPLALHNVML